MQSKKIIGLSERTKTADLRLCLYLNALCKHTWLGMFFRVVSRLGNGVFWYVLGTILPIVDSNNGWLLCGLYFLMGIVGVWIYKRLKASWIRERPFIDHKQIFKACPTLDKYSFPSGHTLHAVAFTTLVSINLPAFAPILIPFAILVALSRPILGLHYPSDVFVGALIGAGLSVLTHNVFLLMV